jgi:hypothetical protein
MADTAKPKDKHMIAAISAVIQYLAAEQEAACMQMLPAIDPAVIAAALSAMNPWGMSGRQDIMRIRSHMQMKGFHGLSVR